MPEDYGVDDTSGIPPANIPKMKYSAEAGDGKPVPPLSSELMEIEDKTGDISLRKAILTNLTVQTNKMPVESLGDIIATSHSKPDISVSETESGVDSKLPEPDLTETAVGASKPTESTESVEPVKEVENTKPILPLRSLTPKDKFKCKLCGAFFKFKSQLYTHVGSKHADAVDKVEV